jgi:hypothetical protein
MYFSKCLTNGFQYSLERLETPAYFSLEQAMAEEKSQLVPRRERDARLQDQPSRVFLTVSENHKTGSNETPSNDWKPCSYSSFGIDSSYVVSQFGAKLP